MRLLLVIVSFLFLPAISFAAGIEVTPSEFDVQINSAKGKQVKLVVRNPDESALKFEAYADDYKERISISPTDFTLKQGEEITLVLDVSGGQEKMETNISIVGMPTDFRELQAAVGVKVPITISTNKKLAGDVDWVEYAIYGVMIFGSLGLASLMPKNKPTSRA
ncbi:MAG: hypothetical protein A3J48_03275 [Candidatus Doudnabacteria bacterium RIFCSPHIGHO2_02_FULL_46_11]|uniref:Uncharacterized protein n=1 Tax=Candidatus Doudnabacteria bacterium RIFCSPHIGHO2_02_FULL_46_11 TaxID=1817832 RepID=A0A1F5P820_9BACT|nr:MAG: hypothetical protein A3J48_03275 [Candidatus Doudnabacteria bacterium RIFCSPHIGHO2_02_FULL_46_11]